MGTWQDFEKECCDYLNNNYGRWGISFRLSGASNSNAPDIMVYKGNIHILNIEVKMAKAQSGQFVVKYENGRFVFSAENKTDAGDAVAIIAHMNRNKEKYKNVGTKSISIDMDKDEFAKWIVAHYLEKNEPYVITKGEEGFIVVPIEKYTDYFKTTAAYRIKKSGSCDVSSANLVDIKAYFRANGKTPVFSFVGKKLYMKNYPMREKEKFTVGKYDYMVSSIDHNGCYLRRLSNTNNANVIFSIELKSRQRQNDLREFEERIRR